MQFFSGNLRKRVIDLPGADRRVSVEDNLTLTVLDNYIIRYCIPKKAKEVVISFEGAYTGVDRSDWKRKGFGEDAVRQNNFAIISILARKVNWYRSPEIYDFFESAHFQGLLSTFEKRHSLGSSMGGLGACTFAELLNIDNVVALQPISDVIHSKVPWEKRFEFARTLNWKGRFSDAASGLAKCESVYMFFDPDHDDARHIERFEQKCSGPARFKKVRVNGAGHAVPRFLLKHKVLKSSVIKALNMKNVDRIQKGIDSAVELNVGGSA